MKNKQTALSEQFSFLNGGADDYIESGLYCLVSTEIFEIMKKFTMVEIHWMTR